MNTTPSHKQPFIPSSHSSPLSSFDPLTHLPRPEALLFEQYRQTLATIEPDLEEYGEQLARRYIQKSWESVRGRQVVFVAGDAPPKIMSMWPWISPVINPFVRGLLRPVKEESTKLTIAAIGTIAASVGLGFVLGRLTASKPRE
eukprot:c54286_g1_i1.p1 GENE.c54286_g1_i1~~c54286_g1_i1.p1  ORF type:complete len:155 (-),score=20.54 c54286_g1_i1:87-518(-)